MARIIAVLATVLTKLLDAAAIAIVWTGRHQAGLDRVGAFFAELSAFLFAADAVGRLAGWDWALVPLAVYLLLQSISWRRRADRGGR